MKKNRKIPVITLVFLLVVGTVTFLPTYAEEGTPAPPSDIVLSFSFPEPVITQVQINDAVYDQVTLEGVPSMNDPGLPVLPVKPVKVLLPQASRVTSVEIITQDAVVLGYGFQLELGSDIMPRDSEQNGSGNGSFDPLVPYPPQRYNTVGTYYSRGYGIFLVNLYPVYYTGETGEVSYYPEMMVIIHLNETGDNNSYFRGLPQDRAMLQQQFVDDSQGMAYRTVDTYTVSIPTKVSELPYHIDYVIITTNALHDAFQEFADYKNSINTTTTIVTVDDIVNNSDYWVNSTWGDGTLYGRHEPLFNDTQAKIRNFVRMAYKNWTTEYVLLGGDNEILPARMFYYLTDVNGYDYLMPSDLYYACLDGSYNSDNDTRWGESTDGEHAGDVDLMAEVYIGRACVGNETEVSNFVMKTLGYETATEAYLSHALMVGQWLDDHPTWGDDYMDELINGSNHNGYTTVGIPSSDYNVTTLYDHEGYMWEETIDISPYTGSSAVRIRFRLESNKNIIYPGLYIDDVTVRGDNETLFFDDMEHGENGWTHSGAGDEWELGVPRSGLLKAHSGENCWGTDLDGDYENLSNQTLVSPPVDLSGVTNAQLSFYQWSYTQEYLDNSSVEISMDEGESWLVLNKDNGGWTQDALLPILNSGTHLINHIGHADWDSSMKLSINDVDNLTNTQYCFIYSQGCDSGSFTHDDEDHNDSIAEHFTVKTSYGAFAGIWNARSGYYQLGGTNGPSQRFQRLFWDAVYGDSRVFGDCMREIGRANQNSKEDTLFLILNTSSENYYRRVCYGLNLFGDPEVVVKPAVIPEHDLSIYWIDLFDWQHVNAGETVTVTTAVFNRGTSDETGVTVNLLSDGAIVASETIDLLVSNGRVTVSLDYVFPPGKHQMMVQIEPVDGEINTSNNELNRTVIAGPDVAVLDVDVYPPMYVNGVNGVNVTVSNLGLTDVSDVVVRLIVDNDSVGSVVVPWLPSRGTEVVTLEWTPVVCRWYSVSAFVESVVGEGYFENNVFEGQDVRVVGHTVFVDDDGDADFETINDALFWVGSGDIVYVFSGVYQGGLYVGRSVTLMGEDRETTVIDGRDAGQSGIVVNAPHTNISGFTIKNCTMAGVWLKADNVTVAGNIYDSNRYGVLIMVTASRGCLVRNNTFMNNVKGVNVVNMSSNTNRFIGNNFVANTFNNAFDNTRGGNVWVGNYWDDFENNSGYPNRYQIPPFENNDSSPALTSIDIERGKPLRPEQPVGSSVVNLGEVGMFNTSTVDPDGDSLYYFWEWGDGLSLVGPFESGAWVAASHTWQQAGQTYYVKVKARDVTGLESNWSEPSPPVTINAPPNESYNPYPPDGAINVNINDILSWNCTDPESNPLTYDIYFGTVSPPPIRVHNQSSTTYNPGTLTWGTTYYWRIIAWDNHSASTTGSLWQFTTHINQPPNIPSIPAGPTVRLVGESGTYTTSATDPDTDQVKYRFDWDATGSHEYSTWTALGPSGHTDSLSHTWAIAGTYRVKAQTQDEHGVPSGWSPGLTVVVDRPPDTPSIPSGPTVGYHGTSYTYSTSATDPDGDDIYYLFDWGDGTNSGWVGPYPSGASESASHVWSSPDSYIVGVKAKDSYNYESGWSQYLPVQMLNRAPDTPCYFAGPTWINRRHAYEYTARAVDPDGDTIQYEFYSATADNPSQITDFVPSDTNGTASYQWSNVPLWSYVYLRVRAVDQYGASSGWPSDMEIFVGLICFLENTKITMADGSTKNIQDIQVGEYVKSWYETIDKFLPARVTKVYHHNASEMTDYYLVINHVLRVTPNHPLYVNDQWEVADKAKTGDHLLRVSGNPMVITSVEKVYQKTVTYDFEVETPEFVTAAYQQPGMEPLQAHGHYADFYMVGFKSIFDYLDNSQNQDDVPMT